MRLVCVYFTQEASSWWCVNHYFLLHILLGMICFCVFLCTVFVLLYGLEIFQELKQNRLCFQVRFASLTVMLVSRSKINGAFWHLGKWSGFFAVTPRSQLTYSSAKSSSKECRESSSIPYNTTFAKHASNSGNSPNDQWEISALEAKRKRLVHSSLHYIPRLSSFTVNSVWKVYDTCIIFKHSSENCQKLEIWGLHIRLNTFVPISSIF